MYFESLVTSPKLGINFNLCCRRDQLLIHNCKNYTADCTRYTIHCTLHPGHCGTVIVYMDRQVPATRRLNVNTYDYAETHDYWFLYLFSFILISYSISFPFILVLSNSTTILRYTLGTFPCGFWSCTFGIFVFSQTP